MKCHVNPPVAQVGIMQLLVLLSFSGTLVTAFSFAQICLPVLLLPWLVMLNRLLLIFLVV